MFRFFSKHTLYTPKGFIPTLIGMGASSHSKRGFTLVELLVVISIIGLLSSTVLAAVASARIKADHAAALDLMKQYYNAIIFAYDANGEYPDGGALMVEYCLGDYSDNAGCGWRNLTTGVSWGGVENQGIKDAISPYMPSFPTLPLFSVSNDWGWWDEEYRGPTYWCLARTNGMCTRARMYWVQKGAGQTCLNGQMSSTGGGDYGTCYYDFN